MGAAPGGSGTRQSETSAAAGRRARAVELRAREQRRERRRSLAVRTSAGVLLAALVGGGVVVATRSPESGPAPTEPAAIPGVQTWTGLGRTHVTGRVDYPQTPPVGGNHNPVWLECNGTVYDGPVANENAVHSMEHGAVWVTYNGAATADDIRILAEKVTRTPYSFMSPYPDEKGTVTLTAWGTQLVLDNAKDPRVEQFFTRYVQGPQTQEPGASCSAGSMPLPSG